MDANQSFGFLPMVIGFPTLSTSAWKLAVRNDAETKRGEEPSVRPSRVVVRRLAHTSGDELGMEGGKEGADGTGCVRTSKV